MKKTCFWADPGYQPSKPLSENVKAEFLIVGGGVTGLFAAHFLLRQGVRASDVVVMEKEAVGSGSTGHSAGMLVGELETADWESLEHRFGTRMAARYLAAQQAAQKEVRRLVRTERIRCDQETRDLLRLSRDKWGRQRVLAEFRLRQRLGAKAQILNDRSLAAEFGGRGFKFGERLEQSITVNPLKFAHGVAAYLRRRGVRIFERTAFVSVRRGTARTANGTVQYRHLIDARGTAQRHGRLTRYLTTICVTRPLAAKELKRLRLTDKDMFVDDERVSFHYGKVTPDNRLLVGYGDVLWKSKQTPTLHQPHLNNVRRFIARVMGPGIGIDYAWSAAYALSKDPLPLVSVARGIIGGAGTQIASIAAADYFVARLLGKKHPLDGLFG